MQYRFYGWEQACCSPVNPAFRSVSNPKVLYDLLSDIWCEYTCAPRLRDAWSPDNRTLGQCSITAFLAQDIFGGRVYGIPRSGGSYHCYNEVNGIIFDLTSEQFLGESLDYSNNPEQDRSAHFSKQEKLERYEYLKAALLKRLSSQKNR